MEDNSYQFVKDSTKIEEVNDVTVVLPNGFAVVKEDFAILGAEFLEGEILRYNYGGSKKMERYSTSKQEWDEVELTGTVGKAEVDAYVAHVTVKTNVNAEMYAQELIDLEAETNSTVEVDGAEIAAKTIYPESIPSDLEPWKVDARVVCGVEIPEGMTIDSITYNGGDPLPLSGIDLTGRREFFLSEVLGEGVPTRPSITSAEGLEDEWVITLDGQVEMNVKFLCVVSEDGFASEKVLSEVEFDIAPIVP